jgi:hypothetical protein
MIRKYSTPATRKANASAMIHSARAIFQRQRSRPGPAWGRARNKASRYLNMDLLTEHKKEQMRQLDQAA